jgi:hypothetical protein
MNKPFRITFTGIDESCNLDDLFALLSLDPRIELGILYSETRAGAGRYPTPGWINGTAARICGAHGNGRVALHVCGRAVQKLLSGESLDRDLSLLWDFHRIQLNGRFGGDDIGALRRFIGDPADAAVATITQFDSNPDLHDQVRRPSHQVLFDASGGRGLERAEWPKHLVDWTCGYAGGLGPDNLRRELPRIAAAAGPFPYWIDMESKLRDDDDRFSIGLARLALDAVVDVEGKL